MISPPVHFEELTDLVWSLANDRLDDLGADRLQQLLDADSKNRQVYIELTDQFASLEWERGGIGREAWAEEVVASGPWPAASEAEAGVGDQGVEEVASGQWSVASEERSENANLKSEIPDPPPIIVIDTSSPIASLPSPFYIAHPYLFANLFSLLFMGLAILGAWMYQIDVPRPIAENDQPVASVSKSHETKKVEYVGKITGMVDCKWETERLGIRDWGLETAENHKSEIINHKSLVALGDKFTLASGLMEITYDTGAKVILQGPVTYEVESAAGGFLSVGKLTARLDGAKPQAANHKSEILNQKFVVKTPTATVTDLGTEFGVEVDAQKVCHVETFVGLVNVSPVAGGESKNGRTLAAGESVRIDAAGIMANTQTKSTDFVRNIVRQAPDAYSKLVLEDRPLTYWPLDESPNADWLIDRLDRNRIGHLIRGVRLGQKGPFANGRSRSAEFTGNDYIQTDPLPKSDPAKGFSVEVWARADGGNGQQMFRSPITYREDLEDRDVPIRTGFALYAATDDRWTFWTGTGTDWAGVDGPPVVLGQWVYIVGTFEPTNKDSNGVFTGVKKLFINGDLVATERQLWKPNDTMPVRIGAGMTESPTGDYFFIGRIAEAAIYDRPLDYDRIKAHWEAGKHPDTAVGPPGKEVSAMK